MNTRNILVTLIVALSLGIITWFILTLQPQGAEDSFGGYSYTCDTEAAFTMSPSPDISTITLSATKGGIPNIVLQKDMTSKVSRYTGEAVVLTGAGEEVRLVVSGNEHRCHPVPNTEEAPFNWGDMGEGAGSNQDVLSAIRESINGRWQSTEDEKFVRVFTTEKVTDLYNEEEVSAGTYTLFSKDNPRTVSFPLEENAPYMQMVLVHEKPETLNFKITKITPEVLEMIYMDRGGVLTFKRL